MQALDLASWFLRKSYFSDGECARVAVLKGQVQIVAAGAMAYSDRIPL